MCDGDEAFLALMYEQRKRGTYKLIQALRYEITTIPHQGNLTNSVVLAETAVHSHGKVWLAVSCHGMSCSNWIGDIVSPPFQTSVE